MADETGQAEVFPVAHSPHAHQLEPCSGYALVIRRNRPCPPSSSTTWRFPPFHNNTFIVLASLHGALCRAVLYCAARWCYLEGFLVFFT